MFLDTAPQFGRMDVPDPHDGGVRDFDYAIDLIEAGARGWLNKIRATRF